jgi:predicted transposase YdaD
MPFDNTCKFLAEHFSADIATWLFGTPITLSRLEPSELFAEPIRADAVIFLESEDLLAHIEFQTDPVPLSAPGLLPFAVLSQAKDKVQVLREVSRRVDNIGERRDRSNVAAASAILAGLLLEKDVINQVLRKDIMRESVIYQEIEAEAEARGEARGQVQGELNLVLRQLTRRFGAIAPTTEAQIRQLSLSQLEAIGEALLDFSSLSDLDGWLQMHGA